MISAFDSQQLIHQLAVDRRINGIVKQCISDMENADGLIADFIRKTEGVYTKQRYHQIKRFIKKRADELGKTVAADTSQEDFIKYELEEQQNLWNKHMAGSNVNLKYPTVSQAVTTATFGQYTASSNFENYLNSLADQYFNVWDSNVRGGYLAGITTQEIVRKVVGTKAVAAKVADHGAMHALRVSVQRNTRTALQAMACETRKLIYQENEDIFSGYKWLSTLDLRTCHDCSKLDGMVQEKMSDFPELPLHYNCRCIIVPVVKDYDDLDDNQRASQFGMTDAVTYEEWIESLEPDVKAMALGLKNY